MVKRKKVKPKKLPLVSPVETNTKEIKKITLFLIVFAVILIVVALISLISSQGVGTVQEGIYDYKLSEVEQASIDKVNTVQESIESKPSSNDNILSSSLSGMIALFFPSVMAMVGLSLVFKIVLGTFRGEL